jgi:hypothetical protein
VSYPDALAAWQAAKTDLEAALSDLRAKAAAYTAALPAVQYEARYIKGDPLGRVEMLPTAPLVLRDANAAFQATLQGSDYAHIPIDIAVPKASVEWRPK